MDIYVTWHILGWILLMTMCITCTIGVAMMIWTIVQAVERYRDRKRHLKELLKTGKPAQYVGNANTCISCGAVIPEGGWTCPNCENN